MKFTLKEGTLSPRLFRVLFLIASAAALFSRFFSHGLLLGFYQDDFFYYLKIAQNLAVHGISSFDGIHLTNGYHPLWLLTLFCLYRVLPGISFFVGLQTLTLIAAIAFYAGTERVLRVLSIPEPLRSILTLLVSLQALLLLRYGMEITLALPLAVWLLYFFLHDTSGFPPRRIIGIGFFASCTVLARLDAILLVGLLFLSHLYVTRGKGIWKWTFLFLAGFTPVFIYLAVNYHFFHLLTPVSGQAKQLKAGFLPSPVAVLSLVRPMDRMKIVFILPCLALLAIGIAYAWKTLRTLRRNQAAVILSVLIFPVVHLLVLSVLSDWALWPWYFYTFVLSSLASCIVVARTPQSSPALFSRWLKPLSLLLCCVYLVYIAGYSVLYPNSVHLYTSSAQLAGFMDAHPGIYAMGDQGGTTGYLSKEPVIQLEGLVMDSNYLLKIKNHERLRQILNDYDVSYYVTLASSISGNCIVVREPSQAGPDSPVSTGKICSKPIATFYRMNVPIEVFPAQAVQ